jgi:hypothetical protein
VSQSGRTWMLRKLLSSSTGSLSDIAIFRQRSAASFIFAQSHPTRSMIGLMAIPVALPALTRKRGNPNWGCPIPPAPALATEFELQVTQLQLTAEMYTSSRELHIWCERNRNRVFIPEWLLQEWDITVDALKPLSSPFWSFRR